MELKSSGIREDRIFTDMMTGATDEREGVTTLVGPCRGKMMSSSAQKWIVLDVTPPT
jgi:hypothetical protein